MDVAHLLRTPHQKKYTAKYLVVQLDEDLFHMIPLGKPFDARYSPLKIKQFIASLAIYYEELCPILSAV